VQPEVIANYKKWKYRDIPQAREKKTCMEAFLEAIMREESQHA
jgi:hypothetical protein